MGLFDKLFGKGNNNRPEQLPDASAEPHPTAEMMQEDQFWSIVADSLRQSRDQDEQEAYLIRTLEKLPLQQIIGFRLRTDRLLYDSYTPGMWCAGFIMNQGCSDDGFEYFRNWVISRGKDVYYQAKLDPDTLVSQATGEEEMYEFESFWTVALEAFENRTGKDLYDFIDDDNFTTKEGNYPEMVFNWSEDDPESRRKICPRLFERFPD